MNTVLDDLKNDCFFRRRRRLKRKRFTKFREFSSESATGCESPEPFDYYYRIGIRSVYKRREDTYNLGDVLRSKARA